MKTKMLLTAWKKLFVSIRVVFGFIYIAAGVLIFAYAVWLITDGQLSYRFSWEGFFKIFLSFFAGAILNIISGIFTLKGKHWLWAIIGLIITVLAPVMAFTLAITMSM